MTDERRATPLPAAGPGAVLLLAHIARAEGTTGAARRRRGYDSDYDVTFNYGRSEPAGRTQPLSEMTLDEVNALQRRMRGSSAVGRYQIVRRTLDGLRARYGLDGCELFDGELQDRLARALLAARGYDRFCAGEISADEAMDGLAREWASLPDPDGGSHYRFGGKPQPVRTTRAALRAALEAARAGDRPAPGAPT
jgi:muramidase (phage lysozyme)